MPAGFSILIGHLAVVVLLRSCPHPPLPERRVEKYSNKWPESFCHSVKEKEKKNSYCLTFQEQLGQIEHRNMHFLLKHDKVGLLENAFPKQKKITSWKDSQSGIALLCILAVALSLPFSSSTMGGRGDINYHFARDNSMCEQTHGGRGEKHTRWTSGACLK